MNEIALSVVAPVFNEAPILPELARRCAEAALATGLTYEVILVDDASTDETERLAPSLSHDGVRFLRLPKNRGQLGATLAGLAAAQGDYVVVLDGDLQDPPEMMGALLSRLRQGDRVEAVFAVKQRRDDPAWFRFGAAIYRWLQRRLARTALPSGAGSYCAISSLLARQIAALPEQDANLSVIIAALGHPMATIPYIKEGRYDGRSRVGLLGLVREATGSLLLTGALERLAAFCTGLIVVARILFPARIPFPAMLVAVLVFFPCCWVPLRYRRLWRLRPRQPSALT